MGSSTRTTPVAAIASMLVIGAAVAGCAGGSTLTHPTQKPEDARQSIIELVDAATQALGGEWNSEGGPRLGTCANERGEGEGVKYTYIKRRTDRGDRRRDIRTLERLWSDGGLDTDRFSTGGGTMVGVNGRGGAALVIGYNSSDLGGGDSVVGTSWCAAGDFVEMRERGEE
ncbi:hypothetical protein [Curtobacterium pusillum]|uniref:hypothetical protein n=1 Tax=Curtobacterium pusillum TaxID=69373 RepID=UPI0011A4C239|nr:hypothetical protein [Curtobacterium pusillum]